jgi:hypothetical protein
MNVINIKTGLTDTYQETNDIYLPPGPGSLTKLNCPNNINGTTHFMSIDVYRYTTDGGGSGGDDASSRGRRRRRKLESHNSPLLFSPPKDITTVWCDSGLDVNVLDYNDEDYDSYNYNYEKSGIETETIEYVQKIVPTIQIEVTATVPVALLVVLTTQAHGRFSDNAFTIIGGKIIIEFYPFDINHDNEPPIIVKDIINLLKRTLRVEDMAMHQHNDKCRRSKVVPVVYGNSAEE